MSQMDEELCNCFDYVNNRSIFCVLLFVLEIRERRTEINEKMIKINF